MSSGIFDEKDAKSGTPFWKIFIVTGLIVLAFMVTTDIMDGLNGKYVHIPIISPLFDFPPFVFQTEEAKAARQGRQDEPLSFQKNTFFTPLVQFIIAIVIIIALILLVIFK
jgi:hypothetical protein